MPNFLLAYRNPRGYTRTPETAAAWMSWLDGLGPHLVELGQPAVEATSLGTCDRDATDLGGYSIIQADDLDHAVTLASGCPNLGRDGGVEVGVLAEVPARTAAG